MSDSIKTKYPKMHEKCSGHIDEFCTVWNETFPSSKNVALGKMDKRRERAKIAKEWEEK